MVRPPRKPLREELRSDHVHELAVFLNSKEEIRIAGIKLSAAFQVLNLRSKTFLKTKFINFPTFKMGPWLKKSCSPPRITNQTFLAYLGHQWSSMQLQNQRKRFYINLFYDISS